MIPLLEAHYRFQRGLYQPLQEDLGPLRLHWSSDLPDPDWNHARLRGAEAPAPEDLDRLLPALEARFAELGRPPVLALSHPTTLESALQNRGWRPRFEHRWQLWPEDRLVERPAEEFEMPIAPATEAEDERAFLDVFVEGFGLAGEEAEAWRQVLRRSFREEFEEFRIRHYLARVEGEPAGVATLCLDRTFAGCYNLAVRPAFRRRGLGSALMHRRIRDARAADARHLFLQTESAEVETWDRRRGLVPGPVVVGWGPVGVGE